MDRCGHYGRRGILMVNSRIAFVSTMDDEMDIWTMAADRSARRHLSRTPDWEEDHPAWSPDGTIAFCSRRHGKGEIYIMDADGGSLQRLTENNYPDLRARAEERLLRRADAISQ